MKVYVTVEVDRLDSGELDYYVELYETKQQAMDALEDFLERHEDASPTYAGSDFAHLEDDEWNRFSFTIHEKQIGGE